MGISVVEARSGGGAVDSLDRPRTRSVERAFAILELLQASGKAWNTSEMSRHLRIPKSTAHVLIGTLEKLGYVRRLPSQRSFTLGPKLQTLAQPWMGHLLLPDLAVSHMKWLVEETGLTAHLAVMGAGEAIYIQKVESPGGAKFDSYPGKHAVLHCTAVGKALLAFAPEGVAGEYLSRGTFARHTEKTITSAAALNQELLRVRRRGYAVDDEEEELGVRCVAIPVFAPGGNVAEALGVTGTVNQIVPEFLAGLVSKMKRAATGIFVREGSL